MASAWPPSRFFSYVVGHCSCKSRVKFWNLVNFSGNHLAAYVVNHYFVLFIIIVGLGLDLMVLASASAKPRSFGLRLGLKVLASFIITGSSWEQGCSRKFSFAGTLV